MDEKNAKGKFITTERHELPPDLLGDLKRAKHLEWITVYYLISVVAILFAVLGSSQAMKTAWLEDMLSLLPPLLFLIAYSLYDKKAPDFSFPYGLHKVFSVAFLLGSFALLAIGIFAFYGAAQALLHKEIPTIGNIFLFGYSVWMGWIMILALLWSFIPAVILGRKKIPLSEKLHNKILFTDAMTQRADWQTALAAIVGIVGIGFGIWWTDAVASLLISLNITHDGWNRTKDAITDFIEQLPTALDNDKKLHPLTDEIYSYFKNCPG